jgi:hypothetical protein
VFAVYDYDRFSSSDQTGEYQLPLNQVDLAGPVQEWKDLAPVDDGSNQYLGDLCISLRYVPSSGKLTGAAGSQQILIFHPFKKYILSTELSLDIYN